MKNRRGYLTRLGEPIKSWISKEDTTYTDVFDVETSIPEGSWWVSSKITNPVAVKLIDEKQLTAYSLTTAERFFADKIMELLPEKNMSSKSSVQLKLDELLELLTVNSSFKYGSLIKDIVDPVGFTVSLTDFPCVSGAIFSKKCLETQQSNKSNIDDNYGSDNMTNENKSNGMSIEDVKGLFSLWTSFKSKDDDKSNDKSDDDTVYVTEEKFQEAMEDLQLKLHNDLSTELKEGFEKVIADLKDDGTGKDKDKGKDEDKKKNKSDDVDNNDDGASDDINNNQNDGTDTDNGNGTSKDSAGDSQGDSSNGTDINNTSNKNRRGDSQGLSSDGDGISNKRGYTKSTKARVFEDLNRDSMGYSKIKL